MSSRFGIVFLAVLLNTSQAYAAQMMQKANPIRRVVKMMTVMQKKLANEGSKAEEIYEKFKVYCNTTSAFLAKSIEEAQTAVHQLEGAIEEGRAEKTQLEGDIAKAKADEGALMTTMAEVAALREKEAMSFAKASAEYKANVEQMTKALAALEKGSVSIFFQSAAADQLKHLARDAEISSSDRDTMLSFLSGGQGNEDSYESGGLDEAIGIVKQMKESFIKATPQAEEIEVKAKENFKKLEASKQKEIAALTQTIQFKEERLGQVGMEVVNAAEQLEDTRASLDRDTQLSAKLKTDCGTQAWGRLLQAAELLRGVDSS